MKRSQLYISTVSAKAAELAARYGIGIEIAEFCTASNMDADCPTWDTAVREKIRSTENRILHGPFNELFPCAIDPKARELAAFRYGQAMNLAKKYGAKKVVFHGGFHPFIYFPVWYIQESACFWKQFMDNRRDDLEVVLENVLEEEPEWQAEVIDRVGDPRLKLCLDVGHVNTYSKTSVEKWIRTWGHRLSHFHIHNNDGSFDTHSPITKGSLDIPAILDIGKAVCENATYTLEIPEPEDDIERILGK